MPGGLDPGLGVFFMDLCTHAIDPSLEYDEDGQMARAATTNDELLAHMLQNKYYAPDRELPIGVGPDDFPETLFKEYEVLLVLTRCLVQRALELMRQPKGAHQGFHRLCDLDAADATGAASSGASDAA